MLLLAWEPNVVTKWIFIALGTNSYSCCLPALCRKLRLCLFFPIKVDPLNLESQNQTEKILMVLLSSPIKIWDKSVPELFSDIHTNKQTKRHYNMLCIYRFIFKSLKRYWIGQGNKTIRKRACLDSRGQFSNHYTSSGTVLKPLYFLGDSSQTTILPQGQFSNHYTSSGTVLKPLYFLSCLKIMITRKQWNRKAIL